MKQVIAIGGGIAKNPNDILTMLDFILSKTLTDPARTRPKVCFLGQASKEDPQHFEIFSTLCQKLGADATNLSLFGQVTVDVRQTLLSHDAIFVDGGNTRSLLGIWRAWDVDKYLQEAYDKGILLAGSSAGGLCWFEQGLTDSTIPYAGIKCLEFLAGSFCPHFDTEFGRQSVYRAKIKSGELKPGLALSECTAAYYVDGKRVSIVTTTAGKKALYISKNVEYELPVELLPAHATKNRVRFAPV